MLASFLSLPNNLSCGVLSDWVDISCLGRLDSAYCSISERELWLELVRSEELTIKTKLFGKCERFSGWVLQRRTKVSKIYLSSPSTSSDFISQYLRENEKFIRDLVVSTADSPAINGGINFKCSLFHYLRSLDYSVHYPEDNEGLLTLLHNNRFLTKLKIHCPSSHRLEGIFASVSLPQLLSLSCKVHKHLMPLFSQSLLRLDLDMDSYYKIPDNVVRPAAMRCPRLRTLRCQSVFLPAFLESCPHIVNLCVTNCDCLTDATVLEIVQKLRCLRVLDISDCTTRCTTAALEHIASHCGNTLEELHIYLPGQAFPLVEALRSQLKKLHTFVWVSCYRTLFCSVVVKNDHVTVEAPALADRIYFQTLTQMKRIDVLVLGFPIYQSVCSVSVLVESEVDVLLHKYPELQTVYLGDKCAHSAREILKTFPEVTIRKNGWYDKRDWMMLPV